MKKYTLADWLTCKKEMNAVGITDDEINEAMLDLKMDIDTITDKEGYEFEPRWKGIFEIVKENYHYDRYDYKIIGGVEYEGKIPTVGFLVRIPGKYQGLKHGKIVHRILEKRHKWFNLFKWSIYEWYGGGNFHEIYMDTENGSLYVPIEAILKNQYALVESRMQDYFKAYRNNDREKVKKDIAPLESSEAKLLRGYLEK
jgi:hypothetical protein